MSGSADRSMPSALIRNIFVGCALLTIIWQDLNRGFRFHADLRSNLPPFINNDQHILHICDDAQGWVPLFFNLGCTSSCCTHLYIPIQF